MVVTTGAVRRAKLQSNYHHQQTNTHCFTGRMTFPSPNQQSQSTEGIIFTICCITLTASLQLYSSTVFFAINYTIMISWTHLTTVKSFFQVHVNISLNKILE